jgi:hypothetical protein
MREGSRPRDSGERRERRSIPAALGTALPVVWILLAGCGHGPSGNCASSSCSGGDLFGVGSGALPGVASIWAIHDGEKIDRHDLSSPFKAANASWDGTTIKLFGARNEVLAFQLVVEADANGAAGLDVGLPELRPSGCPCRWIRAITRSPPRPLPAPSRS